MWRSLRYWSLLDGDCTTLNQYQLQQAEACYPGIPGITHEYNGDFICCEISLVTSTMRPPQGEDWLKHWSSWAARKMCFLFQRLFTCQPPQTINGFIFSPSPHGLLCNIRPEHGRDWGMVVVVSVNVGVSGCLECQTFLPESNISRAGTFNTTYTLHTILQWLTLYDWSVTKFPVLSGLGWTPELSVWISEEGKKGELIFHRTTRTVNHQVVAQQCFGWRKLFLTERSDKQT